MIEKSIQSNSKASYWTNELTNVPSTAPYKLLSDDDALIERKVGLFQSVLPTIISEDIISIAKDKDINIYKLFLAALNVVLSQYNIYKDILVTTSSVQHENNKTKTKSALLFFRLFVNQEQTVKELLSEIHKELLSRINNQNYDYKEFSKVIAENKEATASAFELGFYFDRVNLWHEDLNRIACLFSLKREGDKLSLESRYNKNKYTEEAISLLSQHIIQTISLILQDFTTQVGKINFITETDQHFITKVFNDTVVDYDSLPVITQFERQVAQSPNEIAIKSGGKSLTYQELDTKANQVANYLIQEVGIKSQDKVALMVNRSEKVIIGILAILKAGGVYIPIDLSAPQDRINFFLEDSKCVAILTEDAYLPENKTTTPIYISIDVADAMSKTNPKMPISEQDLVYMIYTSGTTGRPKGTMVFHYSLSNHVNWFRKQFKLTEADSTMLINSYSFDGCYSYIWATITSGGVLHIPQEQVFDPDLTLQYIKQEKVTFLKLVPSTFGVLVNSQTFDSDPDACNSIRVIKQGGEAINVNNLRRYLNKYPNIVLGNHYGATECTIGSVAHWITKDTISDFAKQPVLGKPFDNQQVYILNEQKEMAPIGVFGEICIAGTGVGNGYFNRQELTDKKFIKHPFEAKGYLYRTGDQGRWLPNGTLEFVGRLDNQVKLRGYRIELDEVAETVKEFPAIHDAIALLHKKDQEDFLALWFIANEPVNKKELVDYLSTKLPLYMMPHFYVQLDKIPLTPNGKIDKKALPNPEQNQTKEDKKIELPTTETEVKLIEIWQQLFALDKISTADNFFEIGGHSLKAIQLTAQVHQQFNIRLAILDVFLNPTIVQLGQLIDEKDKKEICSAIVPIPAQSDYDVSHAQQRMWVLNQIIEDPTVYNIPHAITLKGQLNIEAFKQAIYALVHRHEALRTIFVTVDGTLRQRVLENFDYDFEVQYDDLTKTKGAEKKAKQIAEVAAETVFELDKTPPLLAHLLKVKDDQFIFLFTLHHIISDGWSTQVFTNELLSNYKAICQNETLPQPLKIQYKDFAHWQNQLLQGEQGKASKAYWQEKFSGELPIIELPIDYARPKNPNYQGATQTTLLNNTVFQKLEQFANANSATLYMVLLAAVKTLLHRYTGQNDLIIGTPIAGREHADLADQIGFYVNTLAIRSEIKGDQSFNEITNTIKDNLLNAYEHQLYPFDELIEDLNLSRSTDRSPLFDVMVVMQNNEKERKNRFEAIDLEISDYDNEYEISKFDLIFNFCEEANGLALSIDYRTELFSTSKIERMLGHLTQLLDLCLDKPTAAISQFNYLSNIEKTTIAEFNGKVKKVSQDLTVHKIFEKQARKTPSAIALVDKTASFTYEQLNDKATEVAIHLTKELDVRSREVVTILCDSSADFIINILGVLKAGAAYLPLMPDTPISRINQLIDQTKSKVAIIDSEELIKKLDKQITCLHSSKIPALTVTQRANYVVPKCDAEALAYIMFTSGSTGTPKGVMVNHKGIIRLVTNTNYTNFTEKDKVLQTGSLSFDASTFHIWGALLNGGELHIPKLVDLLDIERLSTIITEKGITKMFFTTSWFNQLTDLNASFFQPLTQILVGGEKLSPHHIRKVKEACPNLQITNGYGPTENTSFSICGDIEIPVPNNVPLGIPISNSTVYILDAYNQPVPVGVVGELVLGGEGISMGYINDEERTKKSFVPSPYKKGTLIYKSGDKGRWLEDGKIEFLGRIDDQVKIRGFRIEPEEIAVAIVTHKEITEAKVIIKKLENEENILVAYYMSHSELAEEDLKSYLKQMLPNYMIPSFLIIVDSIPLNANGKVDKKKLPEPDYTKKNGLDYLAPSNAIEQQLVKLLGDMLALKPETISLQSNFFDLGGHSLKAMMLAGRIKQTIGLTVPLKIILSDKSIKELAAYLASVEASNLVAIPKAPKKEFYPTSPAQQRLYYLQQVDEEGVVYNIPTAIELPAKYSVSQIEAAIQQLVQRHNSLRTAFQIVENELSQFINDELNFKIALIDNQDTDKALTDFVKPFILNQAPLFRVGLIKQETDNSVLLLDMHHIITDGLSQSVLIGELLAILEGEMLEDVGIQYTDYVDWLYSPEQKETLTNQENYWLDRFSDELPTLTLPLDYQRTANRSTQGCNATFYLSKENTDFLKALGQKEGVTLYSTMLSLWSILLSKLGAVEDIAIGTPVAGRTHPDLEQVVGMFVNTLALRLKPVGNVTFLEYLNSTQADILNDFENQSYPFEKLVDKVWNSRDAARSPIFDTMFSLFTKEEFKLDIDLNKEHIVFDEQDITTKFELNFKVFDLEDSIVCSLDYNKQLYKKNTINQFISRFNSLIDSIRINKSLSLSKINLLTESEKHQLVNNTKTIFDNAQKTINQLFEEKVDLYPNKPALIDDKYNYTLLELNQRANQLATLLRAKGVQSNDLVGILLPASAQIIVSILGIFKAGGAYVPLDTEMPDKRIKYILKDSNLKWLISLPEYTEQFDFEGQVINVDDPAIHLQPTVNLGPLNKPEDLAYVIYTSGSTGNPKGVEIAQNQTVNYSNWFTKELDYTYKDSTILISSFSFDHGHSNIFPTIANGGTLHVLPKETYLLAEKLGRYVIKHQITFMKFTPTLFSVLSSDKTFKRKWLDSVRFIMLGGEAIVPADVEHFLELYPNKKVINHYGPTETSIACVFKSINKDNLKTFLQAPVIGKPISNMGCYILDKYLQPVPIGVPGELYLFGAGISRGYINNPTLTQERFVDDPFVPNQKMYASGDWASWSKDYEVIFRGRMDDQVKIRGYRVELGEIEKAIQEFIPDNQVCVLLKTRTNGEKIIVAFIETNPQFSIPSLRAYLEKRLPQYMIPAFLMAIEHMPMTPGGKKNRQVLLQYDLQQNSSHSDEVTTNKLELRLLDIFSEILRLKVSSTQSNFFSLGGNSLNALKLIHKITTEWQVKVPLKIFLENPNVRTLAAYIDMQEAEVEQHIMPALPADHYPLSHAQRRLWLLHQMAENQVAYNVPSVYKLKGEIAIEGLKLAFIDIVERHEILRTIFKVIDGEPRQFVLPIEDVPNFFEYKPLDPVENEESLNQLVSQQINKSFNMEDGPLIKVNLWCWGEDNATLIINMHHIISDGWSSSLFLEELCDRYNSYLQKKQINYAALPIQYKDYAVWQNDYLSNDQVGSHRKFWLDTLAGDLPRLTLPESYPRTAANKSQGKTLVHVIDKVYSTKLEAIAVEQKATLYMVILAAFKTLCYRYTGLTDIVLGTVVSGREQKELAEQIGFYVNTMALRTSFSETDTFRQLLSSVKEVVLQAFEHQDYPFDLLVSELNQTSNSTRNPLFDIIHVHQNNKILEEHQLALDNIKIEEQGEALTESKFDISLVTRQTAEGLRIFVEYDANIYSEVFLKNFLLNFESLVKSITTNLEQPIAKINYLEQEKIDLLEVFNQTTTPKTFSSIQYYFEQQVAKNPEHLAIINETGNLSYKELNEKANQMARWMLDNYTISKDQIIAFSLERSEWQIISMLAILKTGAAFLPIDYNYPDKRKEFIIEDAAPLFLLTDEAVLSYKDSKNIPAESIKLLEPVWSTYSVENLENKTTSNDLAYIIYTSGSTGKPKGVMIEHRGNINMVTDQIKEFGITPTDRCLQFASISFDASIYEIFIALYAGSTLVLLTDELIANPVLFSEYVNRHQVTFATLPPVYLSSLDKEQLKSLRVLVTAGEAPNNKDAQVLSKKLAYYNAYGPTEYSVCATVYRVQGDEQTIPIGKPLDNTKVYILDKEKNLLPIGCWGEMYLAGKGIARGYINRPMLNKERFIDNPFETGEKLYRTGDVGRWLNTGNIEFQGRKDSMVKIRGYRVELSEIKQVLLSYQEVKDAVILFEQQENGQGKLMAFIVIKNEWKETEIKNHLHESLPHYMQPDVLIKTDKIPLTTNGKVDTKELLSLYKDHNHTTTLRKLVAPKNEKEKTLLNLWSSILNIEATHISTTDNFFEIGGQSILAIKLIGEIWHEFKENLSLRDFIKQPTIQGISSALDNTSESKGLLLPLTTIRDQHPSLFMIPPVFGSSTVFRNLASILASKINCYGLQYRGFDYEETFDESIKAMAYSVVREIKPYIKTNEVVNLLGYSMGGFIATEVTAILERTGYVVNLILLDVKPQTTPIKNDELIDNELVDMLLNKHAGGINLLDHNKQRIRKLLKHNLQLLQQYKFRGKLSANILAIEAEQATKKDKMRGWHQLTTGSFSHRISQGDHFSMIADIHVETLSNYIQSVIKT